MVAPAPHAPGLAATPAPFSTGPPPPPPPEPEAYAARVAPHAPTNRTLRKLVRLLASFDANAPLRARVDAIEDLAAWLRQPAALPPLPGYVDETEEPRTARLRLVVRVLEDVPAWRRSVARVLRSVTWECSALRLFCKTGLPNEPGLLGEAADRFLRPLLPPPPDDHELDEVVARMFPTRGDADWLRRIPPELIERFAAALRGPRAETLGVWEPLQAACEDAIRLLSTRIAALGLSYDVRVRGPETAVADAPFYRLPRACDELLAEARAASAISESAAAAATEVRAIARDCRAACDVVRENLERTGVSVTVVYHIELIAKSLDRLEMLVAMIEPSHPDAHPRSGAALLATLVEGRIHDASLLALVRDNLHLLARKIIERVGDTGEHYITVTRAEYRKMLLSASGGGFLTAGTTALKFVVGSFKLPLFPEGLLMSLDYAGSFVLMQLFGFTLATKQPSMTAAALAHAVHAADAHDADELATLVARTTRSQLAAAIGNVFVVIPSAIALDATVRRLMGRSFLGLFEAGTAEHVLHSLHPLESGTIPYAAFTGVLLWASSVAAGWLENWAVYRRIPDAIAQHRIRRIVGERVTRWAGRAFAHNVSGFGGNVALGFLLGMTAVSAKFFGFPLDVRHVTLSTGALTLAACERGPTVLHDPALWAAAIGILIIGALNFGVSFALAFAVALRARDVGWAARARLLAAVLKRFARHPIEFVFPPKT